MTAYIHIGTPKTGTTSIQKFITTESRFIFATRNGLSKNFLCK